MTVRGNVLFRDALSEPLASGWVTAKGKWEVVDGAIQGTRSAVRSARGRRAASAEVP